MRCARPLRPHRDRADGADPRGLLDDSLVPAMRQIGDDFAAEGDQQVRAGEDLAVALAAAAPRPGETLTIANQVGGAGNNFSFTLMLLGIQNIMRNTAFFQKF